MLLAFGLIGFVEFNDSTSVALLALSILLPCIMAKLVLRGREINASYITPLLPYTPKTLERATPFLISPSYIS